jgi:hypothetical protein
MSLNKEKSERDELQLFSLVKSEINEFPYSFSGPLLYFIVLVNLVTYTGNLPD